MISDLRGINAGFVPMGKNMPPATRVSMSETKPSLSLDYHSVGMVASIVSPG